MSNDQTPEIACNMGAIAPDEREAHITRAEEVFAAVIESRELDTGFAFRLPLETPMLLKTMQWLVNERLCCPFFTHKLTVTAAAFWLELTGPAEVKDEIKAMLGTLHETGALFPDKTEWIAAHTPAESRQ